MIAAPFAVLVSAALALSPATGPGLSASYTYDAFGRRISKTVNGQTLRFLYDGDQLLEDRSATGAFLALYGYGSGIDEVLLRYTNTNQLQVYHHDHLGSVQFLVDFAGTPLEGTAYDAYGAPSSPSALGNRFLFTGREYDAETGLYYYRARYYSPTLGRFLSRDPLGYFDGPNPYTYVKNNPVNFTDPSGTLAIVNPAILMAILLAVLVGAVTTNPTLEAQLQQLGQLVGQEIADIAQGFPVVAGQVCQLGRPETDYDPDVHPVFGKIKPGVRQPDPYMQTPNPFGQQPPPNSPWWMKAAFIAVRLMQLLSGELKKLQ